MDGHAVKIVDGPINGPTLRKDIFCKGSEEPARTALHPGMICFMVSGKKARFWGGVFSVDVIEAGTGSDAFPTSVTDRLVNLWIGKPFWVEGHLDAIQGANARANPAAKTMLFGE
jgi:hypothetical protein